MIEKMRSKIDEAWPKHVQVFGPFFGSTNPCFKPTAAYSTSGHLAASHYSFSQRGGASQKGTWILTSKVLSQVLETLLNLRKCFVSRLPRNNLNKNQGSLKITTARRHKDDTIPCAQATLTVCDCMKNLVFHGSRISLGKESYGFTKAPTN